MLTLDKVFDASNVLKEVIRPTACIHAPKVNPDCDVYLKTENLQVTGSFKVRGAYYKISQLSDEEKSHGVIACSAGNHAQGVALAATKNGAKNAKKGKWRKGPDMRLFKEVRKQLGDVKIIAEDLGFLTKHVVKMLNASGYPGMKVLEFGFDSDNTNGYLPHNFKTTNSICYTGTHDNETILGWIKSCDEKTRSYCKDYLGVTKDEFVPWAMVRLCWSSVCDTAIAQMQDILCLDDKARMNTPSTVGANWKWRLESFDKLDDTLAERLAKITAVYGR